MKINLNDYYYHGLQNPSILNSILKNGIYSRNMQKKLNIDNYSSSKDFLTDEGINGMDYICVAAYNTISFYMFSVSNITLIVKKQKGLKGYLEGEYLIKDEIKDIVGIGIIRKNLSYIRYNIDIYNYINSIKENYSLIKNYNVYDLDTGESISYKEIEDSFNYLNKPKNLNILILYNQISGYKEVVSKLNYQIYDSNINGLSKDMPFNKKKDLLIKRINDENNYDINIIYIDSILDYKKFFSRQEWIKVLQELNLTEETIKSNYSIVMHFYTRLIYYKKIYPYNIPSKVKKICNKDIKNNNIWKNHNYYYEILPTEDIQSKIDNVFNILDKWR